LIGVEGTREQAYTTVQVLEAELTIARTIEALADRSGPAVSDDHVIRAVAAKEQAIGHSLTAGQRRVVGQLYQASGAAAVVVGVAGSGKTTALDAASTALEAAGYRVLGSSTSGQAARTLGTEAHIESRTLASLLARLDHGTERLDDRTVVLVDEAGMADDADLARLTLAVHRARAHLVLVGDHRQLAAVGPGVPSTRSSTGAPGSSPPSPTTSANATPPSAEPSPSSATDRSPRRSPGTPAAAASTTSPPASRPSRPWSTPGLPTPPRGKTRPYSPGGEPTSQPSTASPANDGTKPATSTGPTSRCPAAAPTQSATESSRSPLTQSPAS
jgi:hypothetical protein